MKKFKILFSLVFIIIFSNCILTDENNDNEISLQNTLCTLKSFDNDGNILKPPKDKIYTIHFNNDSTISGKNDCNDFFAKYIIFSGDSLKIDQLVTTEKNCSGDQSVSDKYLSALRKAHNYAIKNDCLYIYYENNYRLIFFIN